MCVNKTFVCMQSSTFVHVLPPSNLTCLLSVCLYLPLPLQPTHWYLLQMCVGMHAVQQFLTARVPATLLIAVITPEVVHVPPPSNLTHTRSQSVCLYLPLQPTHWYRFTGPS